MSLLKRLSARLQNHPKRLIYAEGADPRVLQAARQFATRKLGVPFLVGDKEEIQDVAKSLDVRLDGMKIIQPELSDDFEDIAKIFHGMPKFRSYEYADARELLKKPGYYSTMMLMTGRADAEVIGATIASSSSLRQIFQIVPLQKNIKTASSMMVLASDSDTLGIDGDLFMADCGVIPNPTEEQLADIAVTTAKLVNHLTLERPRVAMLSYCTKLAVTKDPNVLKMKSATALAHEKAKEQSLDIDIDGELQVDAALCPAVAQLKGINSSVAGRANILVFPDLESGNTAYKLVHITSGLKCYGQIMTGLTKPVAEISRGASVDDIFGTSVIVAAQSVDRKFYSFEEQ